MAAAAAVGDERLWGRSLGMVAAFDVTVENAFFGCHGLELMSLQRLLYGVD